MVFKKQFVASIKCNGKILRESGEEVFLPFGSQYSILLKNLSTVRCSVKIFVDGTNVLDNFTLLMDPGQTKEIERYIKNRNLNAGNKFKFIEKTDQIEAFRGNQLEDGLIRVEYQFEKQKVSVPVPHYIPTVTPVWPPQRIWGGPDYYKGGDFIGAVSQSFNDNGSEGIAPSGIMRNSANTLSRKSATTATANAFSVDQSKSGITVAGEKSDQQFSISYEHVDYEPESHNINMKLVGVQKDVPIEKPITVKDNPTCTTCGRKNRFNAKFCNQCGTALDII